MARAGAFFTARDHPEDRARRLNRLFGRVDVAAARTVNVDFAGKPDAAQRMFRARSPFAATIGLTGEFDVPATASTPFLLKVGGVTIAELVADEASTSATFTASASVPADALIELVAPSPQDATLSGGIIRISLTPEE